MKLPEPEPEDSSHPSEDRTNRFEENRLLRACRYKILERLGKREAIWLDVKGRRVKHSEALRRVRARMKRA